MMITKTTERIILSNQEGVTLLVLNRQGFSPLAAG